LSEAHMDRLRSEFQESTNNSNNNTNNNTTNNNNHDNNTNNNNNSHNNSTTATLELYAPECCLRVRHEMLIFGLSPVKSGSLDQCHL